MTRLNRNVVNCLIVVILPTFNLKCLFFEDYLYDLLKNILNVNINGIGEINRSVIEVLLR